MKCLRQFDTRKFSIKMLSFDTLRNLFQQVCLVPVECRPNKCALHIPYICTSAYIRRIAGNGIRCDTDECLKHHKCPNEWWTGNSAFTVKISNYTNKRRWRNAIRFLWAQLQWASQRAQFGNGSTRGPHSEHTYAVASRISVTHSVVR